MRGGRLQTIFCSPAGLCSVLGIQEWWDLQTYIIIYSVWNIVYGMRGEPAIKFHLAHLVGQQIDPIPCWTAVANEFEKNIHVINHELHSNSFIHTTSTNRFVFG